MICIYVRGRSHFANIFYSILFYSIHFLKDSACWWNARKFVHFVDLEAIFPFSGYKCKYLFGIEGSSLLVTSNKWCLSLNLLATVHSALPLLRKHCLLCSAKMALTVYPAPPKRVSAVVRERRHVHFARKQGATIQ